MLASFFQSPFPSCIYLHSRTCTLHHCIRCLPPLSPSNLFPVFFFFRIILPFIFMVSPLNPFEFLSRNLFSSYSNLFSQSFVFALCSHLVMSNSSRFFARLSRAIPTLRSSLGPAGPLDCSFIGARRVALLCCVLCMADARSCSCVSHALDGTDLRSCPALSFSVRSRRSAMGMLCISILPARALLFLSQAGCCPAQLFFLFFLSLRGVGDSSGSDGWD